jgi:single-stranded DNA-specific DHH superfamily exonuclease
MLTQKQILEIREHLEKAQNPLFFFDNDNDGLTSFLQLQRFIGRGKGISIKSFPDLNISYFRRITELNPDYIFILDKAVVSDKFLDRIKQENIPIVWIDHHQVEEPKDPYINYYNPYLNKKTNEPVAYLSYQITENKKDIWLAMIGCISDCYMPDFYKEFAEKFPELTIKNPQSPFNLLYSSEIGRIARILDFSLKDTTTNVVQMLKFMMKAKGPLDLLEENTKTEQILKRYNEINSKYQELMERARKQTNNKLIYFSYSGGFSISSNLANQLKYEFPEKVIIVAYINQDIANLSLRGDNVLELTLKSIKDIEGATGGGHRDATGAKVNIDDLPKFKKIAEDLVK